MAPPSFRTATMALTATPTAATPTAATPTAATPTAAPLALPFARFARFALRQRFRQLCTRCFRCLHRSYTSLHRQGCLSSDSLMGSARGNREQRCITKKKINDKDESCGHLELYESYWKRNSKSFNCSFKHTQLVRKICERSFHHNVVPLCAVS
jgi:hypothetical protein